MAPFLLLHRSLSVSVISLVFHVLSITIENEEVNAFLELNETGSVAKNLMLPDKSRGRYEVAYNTFEKWRTAKRIQMIDEYVLLVFFEEQSKVKKPPTLWALYSMLKSMLNLNYRLDISRYRKLIDFIKNKSKGYTGVKAKIFTEEQISKFLRTAPDLLYLDVKVVAIFGILGACRSDELVNMCVNDVELHGNIFLVKIPATNTSAARSFTISGEQFDLVKRYKNLRPEKNVRTDRFFLNYQRGKCTAQVIGKHKFTRMPKKIAEFLELPDADRFTGQSLRRTCVKFLTNVGGDMTTIKRRGATIGSRVA